MTRDPHQPPPLPPVVPQYATPVANATDPGGDAQRVFDTVVGPNVRLKDNLIQLACVIAGGAIGWAVWSFFPLGGPTLFGAVIGAVGALVLSGIVIGIVRGVQAARRRKGR